MLDKWRIFLTLIKKMRDSGGIHLIQSMPLGYLDFATLWNNGVQSGDARRFSSWYYPDDSDEPVVTISTVPVPITDFSITSEQVGIRQPERVPQPFRDASPPRAPSQHRNFRFRNDSPEPRRINPRDYDISGQRRHNRQGYERRIERQQQRTGPDAIETPRATIAELSRLQFTSRPKPKQTSATQEAPDVLAPASKTAPYIITPKSIPRVDDQQDATMEEAPPMPEEALPIAEGASQ